MISKKAKIKLDQISEEAQHILKISGVGKNYEETYERAQSTLSMLDITIRMLIAGLENTKINSKDTKSH